jgi:hypothetical protein
VNFIDFSGLTSLILAVQYGLPGTVKCLLDAGANPNILDEVSFIVILFCCYHLSLAPIFQMKMSFIVSSFDVITFHHLLLAYTLLIDR